LRFDVHAQYEIRVYAEIMLDILKKWVPLTYNAFVSNRLKALTLSSEGVDFLKSVIHGKKFQSNKISKRELENIKKIFNF
jgi:thymidylate synthase (FAD)